jgi:predicted transcriptional regulator
MKYTPRIIAPRLANGDSRVAIGHGLPEDVKEGLKAIAKAENKSLSWVLEEVLIDYFGLRRPKYLKRKKKS